MTEEYLRLFNLYLEKASSLCRRDQYEEYKGCSNEEIQHLVAFAAPHKLPEAYLAFMQVMGEQSGRLSKDHDMAYSQALRLQSDAAELLVENGLARDLLKRAWVFAFHDGWEFWFFYLDGQADPPVYQYSEGGAIFPIHLSFSEYVSTSLRVTSG